jgi:CheY-like chemotaxis protein
LVIDDEPSISMIVRRLLSEHDVVCETDGRAALSRLANGETFDVIFCDMMMPTMSGVDVYEAVSSVNPAQGSKIVFLTGGACSPKISEFLANVQNPVVDKPFVAERLRAVIAELVSG